MRSAAVTKQLTTITRSVRDIERAVKGLAPFLLNLNGSATSRTIVAPRPKLKLSPQRRAALKLQGSYLGYMRQLKPGQKAKVRAVKETKGIRVAIAAAKRLAGA